VVNFSTAHTHIGKTLCSVALIVGLAGTAQAQSDDAAVAEYAALLQKIEDLSLTVAHKEVTVATQEQQIDGLKAQIASVDELKASVNPLVDKMISSYDLELKKDAPFNASERFARLTELQGMAENPDAMPSVKLRKAITMYEAEMNYGLTVEQYPGNSPDDERAGWRLAACQQSLLSDACFATNEMKKKIKDRTKKEFFELSMDNAEDAANLSALIPSFERNNELTDGNYLRVGRLALIYADIDGSNVYRYNMQAEGQSKWEKVEGGRAIDLFRAVKMAKGEAAVDVVEIPVLVEN